MRAVGQAERSRGAADFLDRDDVFEIAEAEPTIRFVDGQAMQAELAHLAPQLVAREMVFAVDLLGQRGDLFVGEARHGLADHLCALAELEIEMGVARMLSPWGSRRFSLSGGPIAERARWGKRNRPS